jgi:hypothetical protein
MRKLRVTWGLLVVLVMLGGMAAEAATGSTKAGKKNFILVARFGSERAYRIM